MTDTLEREGVIINENGSVTVVFKNSYVDQTQNREIKDVTLKPLLMETIWDIDFQKIGPKEFMMIAARASDMPVVFMKKLKPVDGFRVIQGVSHFLEDLA